MLVTRSPYGTKNDYDTNGAFHVQSDANRKISSLSPLNSIDLLWFSSD